MTLMKCRESIYKKYQIRNMLSILKLPKTTICMLPLSAGRKHHVELKRHTLPDQMEPFTVFGGIHVT